MSYRGKKKKITETFGTKSFKIKNNVLSCMCAHITAFHNSHNHAMVSRETIANLTVTNSVIMLGGRRVMGMIRRMLYSY